MSSPRIERIRRRFTRALPHYDQAARVQAEMADALAAALPGRRFGRVLELGAGTGLLTRRLRSLEADLYLAVDLVPWPALRAVRPGILLLVADAERLDWLRGRFELLVSNATFQWLSDPAEAVRAYRELLVPGGVLAFTTFGPETMVELRRERLPGLVPWEDWLRVREGLFAPLAERRWLRRCHFASPLEAVRHVRMTGALGHLAPCWSLGAVRRLLAAYERRRTRRGYPLTYEVYLFVWRRP